MALTSKQLGTIPIGESSFACLREDKRIYVDKTDLIQKFASQKGAFFLTRPRRFGKTLLVSTLESLFREGLKFFRGLAIEKSWEDKTYKVLRLDFSLIDSGGRASFSEAFYSNLDAVLRIQGIRAPDYPRIKNPQDFQAFLANLGNNGVVLLIDEYDAPLTNQLKNPPRFQEICDCFRVFFSLIKRYSGCFRFFFLTGITRFHKFGLSTSLNNLIDLTANPTYGALVGITHQELERYFSPYLAKAAEVLGLPEKDLLQKLERRYGGFCFESTGIQKVLAPWSIMNFLRQPEVGFGNYWFTSVASINLMEEFYNPSDFREALLFGEPKFLSRLELNDVLDASNIRTDAFLAQQGYLTIKKVEGSTVELNYPNAEVKDSMAVFFCLKVLGGRTPSCVGAKALIEHLLKDQLSAFVKDLNRLFAGLGQGLFPIENESSFRALLQVFLLGEGFSPKVEIHNAFGRSDLELTVGGGQWILETKVVKAKTLTPKLIDKAEEQVKKYGLEKVPPVKRIVLVFSVPEKKIIKAWELK